MFKIGEEQKISDKVLDERTTRKKILNHAKMLGCEQEIKQAFVSIDNQLKKCTNEKERKDIAALGIFSIYSILGRGGELYIDGKLVYKEKE
jgi:hypothetical protein